MKHKEKTAFLALLAQKKVTLGIKRDLSLSPEIFRHELRVKGLYVWGKALAEESGTLSTIECEVILYNETDAQKIKTPQGYHIFRIRDLQEFPYHAAVCVAEPDDQAP